MPEPELRGVQLPAAYGEPVTVTGWVPERGEVTVEVPPDHPAYAALTAENTRGLSLDPPAWELPALAALVAPDKINLPGNVQVASEPAGNFRRPSPAEENPVDEDTFTPPNVTVSLRVTVPAPEVPAVIGRLSPQLAALLRGDGEGQPLPYVSVSLDAYLADLDGGEA